MLSSPKGNATGPHPWLDIGGVPPYAPSNVPNRVRENAGEVSVGGSEFCPALVRMVFLVGCPNNLIYNGRPTAFGPLKPQGCPLPMTCHVKLS